MSLSKIGAVIEGRGGGLRSGALSLRVESELTNDINTILMISRRLLDDYITPPPLLILKRIKNMRGVCWARTTFTQPNLFLFLFSGFSDRQEIYI